MCSLSSYKQRERRECGYSRRFYRLNVYTTNLYPPTGSLDARTGRKVLELFGKINADYHVTVIMVTHDVLCASFCSRVVFLRDGKFVKAIKKIGSQENFYRNIQEEMGKIDEIF